MKRILVRLRKIRKMIILSEAEFDKEYIKRRIRDVSEEINSIPAKERYNMINGIGVNVTDHLIKERDKAKILYEELSLILKENGNT